MTQPREYGRTFVEENDALRYRIIDPARHIACAMGGWLADCVVKSVETWAKMKATGAVRVRGLRESDRQNRGNLHYWVESRGYVFDESGGVQQVVKKDAYYEAMGGITQRREAEIAGVFFRDEFSRDSRKEFIDALALEISLTTYTKETARELAKMIDRETDDDRRRMRKLAHRIIEKHSR